MNPQQLYPINLAYVTSCREVGLDELIGREVIDPITRENYGYRMGNLEDLARKIEANDNEFASRFNLVAIFIDDDDDQFYEAWRDHELWPINFVVNGKPLYDITERIPSQLWKNLRRRVSQGETKEEFKARKEEAKTQYEEEMTRFFDQKRVDLVVSDSYTTIFGPTALGKYGGRILNIHPAITEVDNPHRLPGLTPTRDAFTRAVYGWIIVDDKHAVDIPERLEIEVEYEGKIRRAVEIPFYNITGVTVHIVTQDVDRGPVVLSRQYRFDVDGITPEKIRTMNYEIKRDILPEALMKYVDRHFVQQLIMESRFARGQIEWEQITR